MRFFPEKKKPSKEKIDWRVIVYPYRQLVADHRLVIISEFTKIVPRLEAQWAQIFIPAMDQGEETMQPSVAIKNLNRILNLCQLELVYVHFLWLQMGCTLFGGKVVDRI